AELKARSEQLVPQQAGEIRQIAEWMATTVIQSIQQSISEQIRIAGPAAGDGGTNVGTLAALTEVRQGLDEIVNTWRTVEASRRTGLDRLDDVLVDVRASISENVTRQHAVLLEVFDQKLSELRLTQMADELPARIGAVISEGIERSHALALQDISTMKAEFTTALDAGLERHRSAIVELGAVGERLAGLA